MDRAVEYLVGDGPSNRYALICRQCQSHNGMALKEEFEYVAYRCCYCFYWNPAKKQRPVAPRLPTAQDFANRHQEEEEEEEESSEGEPSCMVLANTDLAELQDSFILFYAVAEVTRPLSRLFGLSGCSSQLSRPKLYLQTRLNQRPPPPPAPFSLQVKRKARQTTTTRRL